MVGRGFVSFGRAHCKTEARADLSPNRRRGLVLDLDPVRRAAGAIGALAMLRNHAVQSHHAGMAKKVGADFAAKGDLKMPSGRCASSLLQIVFAELRREVPNCWRGLTRPASLWPAICGLRLGKHSTIGRPLMIKRAALLLLLSAVRASDAHDWYPDECCAETHCRPVECSEVKANGMEYVWRNFHFPKNVAAPSQDGACHVCIIPKGNST